MPGWRLPAGEIDPALAVLRRAHLVRVADGTSKSTVEPYHDRIREAVLDHLDLELRKACHRALARALLAVDAARGASPDLREPGAASAPRPPSSSASWSPEAVAVHLHAAGELAQAARYMVRAADQAAAALVFDRAARLYRQALAVDEEAGAAAGPLGGTRDVLARLARALVNACRGAEAAAIYFELAGPRPRAKTTWSSGYAAPSSSCAVATRTTAGARSPGCSTSSACVLPPTRIGLLWRLLWRRAWVRLRGFGSLVRARPAARGETAPPASTHCTPPTPRTWSADR